MRKHRTALGVITPSLNSIMERDYTRLNGLGEVSFHFTRVLNSEDTAEQLQGMKPLAREATGLLSHVRFMTAIGFGCTSGSFLEGAGYDRSVAAEMEKATSLPCITTSGAVLEALRAVGIRRPCVFTPYEEWLSQRSVDFVRDNGLSPAGHVFGYDMESTEWLDLYEPINDWVADNLSADCDGVFISCTNFTWLKGIAPLEARIGLPVVTSNLALLWKLLKTAQVDGRQTLPAVRLMSC